MRTELRDPQVLAAALKETGYAEVEVHDGHLGPEPTSWRTPPTGTSAPTWRSSSTPAAAPVPVGARQRQENDFRIDAAKCLTVSAFGLKRKIWVPDRQPVVRLA